MARKIALVGIGKIARDQHIPTLAHDPDWELAATVSRSSTVDGIPSFKTLDDLLVQRPDIDVVSLTMPPAPRFDYARAALAAGRHVMLEKPPGMSVTECHTLTDLARAQNVSLFATWHSQEAAAVPAAKAWLAQRTLNSLHITWKEDVRRWHPGQEWVTQAGGMGVFDPGINALSIMTKILPVSVHLTSADLTFPDNWETPIAADLAFHHPDAAQVSATFDWRQEGPQTWTMHAVTDDGEMILSDGGATLQIDGVPQPQEQNVEYSQLYQRMTTLVNAGHIDMDLAPIMHAADAFMLGRRQRTDSFDL